MKYSSLKVNEFMISPDYFDYFTALDNDDADFFTQESLKEVLSLKGISPIAYAVSKGAIRCYEKLKTLDFDPSEKNVSGSTLLHYARKVKMAKHLLQEGFDPNARNNDGQTPLHTLENPSVIKALVKAGADVDAVSDSGRTPLTISSDYGQTARMKVLLELGANPNIKENNETCITLLLWGAGVPASRKEKGIKLLLAAGAEPNIEQVKELVELGWASPAIGRLYDSLSNTASNLN